MDEDLDLTDASSVAGLVWICCGLALLAASPFIPATQTGWIAAAVAALVFMAWTHLANPPLPPPVFAFQVLVFNIPLVAWWLSLTPVMPMAAWLAPAIATMAVAYSFSVGAVGLFVWLIDRPRRVRLALIIATLALIAIAAAAIFAVSQAQAGVPLVFAALATTFALLLQRLLALPFDDDLVGVRTKLMALAGLALLVAFLRGLLPTVPAPALVYGGSWLLAGALFTVVASVVGEARASS